MCAVYLNTLINSNLGLGLQNKCSLKKDATAVTPTVGVNNFNIYDSQISNINKAQISFKGYHGDIQPAKKLFYIVSGKNAVYEDAKKRVPGVGDIVKTPSCDRCKVITADYLREMIKTENDGVVEQWQASEVVRVKAGKHKEEKVSEEELKLED